MFDIKEVLKLVKRNDPCPCGSGKKYKKCCEHKEAVQVADMFFEEIDRTIQSFFDDYPTRAEIPAYNELVVEWLPQLPGLHPQLVQAIALEHFFFFQKPEMWQSYMKKVQKQTLRPVSQQVYASWTCPRLFFGEIIDVSSPLYLKVRHAITGEEIFLRRETERVIPEGMMTYTYILPDGTLEDNHYLATSIFIFFAPEHKPVFEKFAKSHRAEEQLLLWQALVANGYNGEEFTTFESNVLKHAEDFLAKHERDFKELRIVLEDYLVEERPGARKEAAIAAGAVRYANENGLIEPLQMTVKDMAEQFGVSASSLTKYYQEITAYRS